MKTRKIIVYGLITVILELAFTALSMTSCEQPTDPPEPTLTGITADYTGGSVTVNTNVNSLKSNLTVTAKYSDNTGKTLIAADYSLSGDLSASGQKAVTVSYEGETTTFNVTVNADITYTAAQTGGTDNIADSTGIVFTFSTSVNSLNLTAADITVSGAAAKGASATLTGTGATRTLAPITVNAAGLATVAIAKNGIEAGTKHVTVYKAGESVPTLTGITAVYNGTATIYPTTPFNDLKANLTVKAQYSDGSEYTLSEHEYNLGGTLTVGTSTITVSYTNGVTRTASFTVTVTALPATYTLAQTGGVNGTTTSTGIVFTFSESVDSLNLSADDITIGGAAAKGVSATLTGTGTTRSLAITVNSAGTATVTIAKTGIEAETKHVTVYKAGENAPTLTGITAVYSGTAAIYPITPLNDLKANLTVKAQYSNGNEYTLSEHEYNLGGTLTVGTSTITVSYTNGVTKTTNFTVTVTNFTQLTENQWADGSIQTPDYEQWFTFTATASTQYIHVEYGTLYDLYVQVYDISGTTVGNQTGYSSIDNSRSLTEGQTYYIRVRPYGTGTYRIGFTTSIVPPGAIELTENQWADGNLPTSNDVQWFTFTATESTQYIHLYTSGTLNNVYVQVYDSSGATVESETRLSSSYTSRSLTQGQTYYIRVRPYDSYNRGTYRIGFTTSIAPPGTNFIPLTENQWADSELMLGYAQWFTFTATASTQYIHVNFGTLTDLYVQVIDSSGVAVGSPTNLYSSTYTSRSLTAGQTYYIRVWVWPNNDYGTYRIAFNTTFVSPSAIQLTENQWTDGSLLPTSGASDQQWFTFTATASTQYIHADFGTLTSLYVLVFDSSGATVGVGIDTILYSDTRYTSRSLTAGQTYCIRVRPTMSNDSGTYRIAFNTSSAAPIDLPSNAIPLTVNQWADGNIPTSDDEQWFTFTATASTQYIHVELGTLEALFVQVYNSSGTAVGSEPLFFYTTNISRSLTTGQTYYIRVTPYSSSYSGAYRIGFTTSTTAPILPSNAIPLTANQWADGNIPSSGGEQWFTFTATASTQYIHADFGTLTSLYVQVYDSSGTAVGSETNLYLYSSILSTSRTLTPGQAYYIRVTPYSSITSGTYRIGFNTTFYPPGTTPLTENLFADGNLPTSSSQQWFSFTATASTQYIHFDPTGTLKDVFMLVYDSSGAEVGGVTSLSGSNTSTTITLTSGQTYYIRVRLSSYNSSYSGTYRIGFNTTPYPPGTSFIPLTANQWSDGSVPTYNGQWFTFTATASTQYIHVSLGTLTYLYARVYDSSGTEVGSQTSFDYGTYYTSRSLTVGQTYYIRVWPYSSYSGTYRIGFTASYTAPIDLPSNAKPLTENQWAVGNIPTSDDVQWFTFTATASAQYIHVNFGTLDRLYVQVYDSSGTAVGSETDLYGSSGYSTNTSRSLTAGQTYYIRVRPNYGSSYGIYRIAFNAATTAPQ